uniref:Chromosome 8 open reading frame 76 n=1 Tax=Scophthalmus maximus TaxID=52904 RepID=A0A8D3A372_SCOMX
MKQRAVPLKKKQTVLSVFHDSLSIFGSAFDDSVFLEARARVRVTLSAYNAKLCEPEWFCESAALDTDDSLEKQKVHKFRGDLALRQENYQKALDAYSCCLEWLDDKNMTIKRDVLEGMARCCTKLGQRDRALDLADLLSKDASNTCHLISLLLLKVSIYQHFGVVGPKVSSLQRLCCLLPFNPWHWLNLGQTCLQLLDNGSTKEEEQHTFTSPCCFVSLRLLLTILRQQQSSFVLQRSERALQTTDEALQRLNPKESTLHTLTEVMSEDLVPEKMREDYQDGESLASVCVQSFRERWWNKILHTGVSETDGDLCRTMPDTTS